MVGYQNQVGETALGGIFKRWEASEKANRERALALLDIVGLKKRADDTAEDLSYPEQKILILSSTGGHWSRVACWWTSQRRDLTRGPSRESWLSSGIWSTIMGRQYVLLSITWT